jgi:2-succinyl-6-hydroxy-2,4-cyclohexadiene-1-carboxylate synthase
MKTKFATMQRLRVATARYDLALRLWGEPSEEALVLLHGFFGSGADWSDIAERFAGARCVIAPDIPGHGESRARETYAPGDYSMENVADGLSEALTLLGVRATHFCGYSMGGRLALFCGLRFPALALSTTTLSATAGLETEEERAARRASDEILAQRLEQEPFDEVLTRWYEQSLFADFRRAPAFPALFAKRLGANPLEAARSLRDMGTGAQPSLWERLPANDIRQLGFVAGARDEKFTRIAERMHALAPRSTLTIIPNAGHVVFVEQPEATFRAIESIVLSSTTITQP